MASNGFTVDGYDAIVKRLSEIEANIRDKLAQEALLEGAKAIQDSISAAVPVSTRNEEHIKNDIHIGKPEQENGDWFVHIGPGKATAWRAGFLEYGHAKRGGGKVPAHPFIKPGMKRGQQKFMRAVAGVITKGLNS